MIQPLDPLNHRSKSDIKKWLKQKDWYQQYIDNLKVEYPNINARQKFLLGENEQYTISSAFCYRDTPEGIEYWSQIEEMFLRWYYYQD